MTTYSSTPLTVLNVAQTFFIDPGVAKNSPTVSLTSIDVFFETKPTATNNKSGILNPGVTLYISGTTSNGLEDVPDTSKVVYGSTVYVAWSDVKTSTDASLATNFKFDKPIPISTGATYAILLKYDGDEAFETWRSVEGDKLIGTNSTTAGPAGQYIGKFYEFSYASANGATINSTLNTATAVDLTKSWKPLNTTDLKFTVYAAKYIPDLWANTTSVDPITGNTVIDVVAERSLMYTNDPYEFIIYDRLNSNNVANVVGGELIWQNNVIQPTTVSVLAGSNTITSQAANFTTLYGSANNDKYIVIYSGTSKNIRKITSINSNGSISVGVPVSFTNAQATFSKVVAGTVDIVSKTVAFGKNENAIVIANSSANSTLRFQNNVVEYLTITAGGTNYSNSDYIVVYNGGVNTTAAVEANAVANLTTNSTGGIISYTLTNKGVGFLTTPTIAIKVANGSANSSGTGATITANVGATLLTEVSNAVLTSAKVLVVPVNSVTVGAVDLVNPYGTSYSITKHYQYYSLPSSVTSVAVANAGSGYANGDLVTFVGTGTGGQGRANTDSSGHILSVSITAPGSGYTANPNSVITTSGGTGANLQAIVGLSRHVTNGGQSNVDVNVFSSTDISTSANTPLILSRSIEVMQANATITTATGNTINTNSSSVVEFFITSNNEFTTVDLLTHEVDVFFQKFAVNNVYTNENTGNGSAVAKHISQVVKLNDNQLAEDIRVYADIYRPPNTDVKIYARIFNTKDSDAFVDKDWTLLEVKAGNGQFSTPKVLTDTVEYTYGFPQYPNTAYTANGTVTTTLSSATINGSNTNFGTEIVANDVVKVYSPLFPINYQIAVVNNVVNTTQLVLKTNVTNNNVVGAGLLIDKIGYKQQAWNDMLNSNVVSYFDTTGGKWVGYNNFAIKIVFLSDTGIDVPRVDSLRAIAVTA